VVEASVFMIMGEDTRGIGLAINVKEKVMKFLATDAPI